MATRGPQRGAQQSGRTDSFQRKQNETVRPSVPLRPGTPERKAYEELVAELGVSGAEVLRRGLLDLHEKTRRSALKEAS
ncbi:hypothetical protein GCM10010357_70860 [Streptomyces luteireticuli]|uniref:CopG family transcriptional regulator n=1 Tax=Streptomyces luteireticuli TaxID=173858 RepID=A0ABP3J303_9ACTN